MTRRLNQDSAVAVVDQPVYAKALEVIWKRSDEFRSVVLRMGSFHICCTVLALIGKRFDGSGLQDLLVESGVVAEGSLPGAMNGKHYNRGVRVHKLLMEALVRLQLEQFLDWYMMQEREEDENVNFEDLRTQVQRLHTTGCDPSAFAAFCNCTAFLRFHKLYVDYCDQQTHPMPLYWQSYIDLVQLLLRLNS